MRELWKRFRQGSIAVSCCMIVLGLVMLIWPEISALAVCYILGAVCVLAGAYRLARDFKLGFAGFFFRFDMTLGLCGILAGILLLAHPGGAVALLPFAVGLYMLFGGVFDIQVALEMRRFGSRKWIVSMILAVLTTIVAFFLFLNPFEGASALMMYVGISLIIGAVQNLYSVYSISRVIKASKKDDVIDVEWTDVE